MTFEELLAEFPGAPVFGEPSVPITGISSDSRQIRAGDLFVALPGLQQDGHRYIPDAMARGAAAIVCQRPVGELSVPFAVLPDTREALGRIASAFYGHPTRRMRLIGVTGTDGKTTTTTLTAAVLRAAGMRTGHCTTVEWHDGCAAAPNRAGFTTAQPPELQAFLQRAAANGCDAVVMEVSSHALATGRVAGCEFDVAVFTNLAREHLDFHGTMDEYRRQKGRLFEALAAPRTKPWQTAGIVNRDDPAGAYMAGRCPNPVFYSLAPGADLVAREIAMTPEGTSFVLSYHGRDLPLRTRLLGRFNVQNWLAAAGAALACGAPEEALARAAALVPPPPGRLEPVDAGQPFGVYVDFAHTPQGLGASLETLRELHQGRVIAVFGHAGERDTDHRRGLVEVARGHCDLFILTMDDPYSEDPAAILEKMRSAALSLGLREGRDFLAILDRRAAFAEALQQARPGDAVLLAGRGHETYIPIGGERIPFQDAIVARELLSVS